jgi:hypothetical protein
MHVLTGITIHNHVYIDWYNSFSALVENNEIWGIQVFFLAARMHRSNVCLTLFQSMFILHFKNFCNLRRENQLISNLIAIRKHIIHR